VTFGAPVRSIIRSLSDGRDAISTRSAALFDRVDRRIEKHDVVAGKDELALRDLMLIDAALAEIAQGLAVADRDTVSSARATTHSGRSDDSLPLALGAGHGLDG
jgi:hypothetical protein